jgi:hypothetical protein
MIKANLSINFNIFAPLLENGLLIEVVFHKRKDTLFKNQKPE